MAQDPWSVVKVEPLSGGKSPAVADPWAVVSSVPEQPNFTNNPLSGGFEITQAANRELSRQGLGPVHPPDSKEHAIKPPAVQHSDPVSTAMYGVAAKATSLPAAAANSIPGVAALRKTPELFSQWQQNGGGWTTPLFTPQQAGRELASGLGLDTKEIEQDSKEGNYGAVGADAAFPILLTLLGSKGARKSQVPAQSLDSAHPVYPALPTEEAATAIKDAINPAPKAVPKVLQNLNNHIGTIKQWAADNGVTLNSRAQLETAMRGGAKEAANHFSNDLLGPVANEVEPAPPNYHGGTIGEGHNATLGQLNARLGEINKTLFPSYEKGGNAAQAALGGEAHAALSAEAASIRDRLYSGIARRHGIDPNYVAEVNQRAGGLGDLADKTRLSLNEEQYQKNRIDRAPTTVNPFSKNNATRFFLDKPFNSLVNAIRGNPADNAVANTFPRVQATSPERPVFNPPAAPASKTPRWQGIEVERPESGVQVTTPEEIAAHQARMQARIANRPIPQPTPAPIQHPLVPPEQSVVTGFPEGYVPSQLANFVTEQSVVPEILKKALLAKKK